MLLNDQISLSNVTVSTMCVSSSLWFMKCARSLFALCLVNIFAAKCLKKIHHDRPISDLCSDCTSLKIAEVARFPFIQSVCTVIIASKPLNFCSNPSFHFGFRVSPHVLGDRTTFDSDETLVWASSHDLPRPISWTFTSQWLAVIRFRMFCNRLCNRTVQHSIPPNSLLKPVMTTADLNDILTLSVVFLSFSDLYRRWATLRVTVGLVNFVMALKSDDTSDGQRQWDLLFPKPAVHSLRWTRTWHKHSIDETVIRRSTCSQCKSLGPHVQITARGERW